MTFDGTLTLGQDTLETIRRLVDESDPLLITIQVLEDTIIDVVRVVLNESQHIKDVVVGSISSPLTTVEYSITLQERCSTSCEDHVKVTTMYVDITAYMSSEIESGGFTSTLQKNARECGDSCAAIQNATVEGGSFSEAKVIIVTSTMAPTPKPSRASRPITPKPSRASKPITPMPSTPKPSRAKSGKGKKSGKAKPTNQPTVSPTPRGKGKKSSKARPTEQPTVSPSSKSKKSGKARGKGRKSSKAKPTHEPTHSPTPRGKGGKKSEKGSGRMGTPTMSPTQRPSQKPTSSSNSSRQSNKSSSKSEKSGSKVSKSGKSKSNTDVSRQYSCRGFLCDITRTRNHPSSSDRSYSQQENERGNANPFDADSELTRVKRDRQHAASPESNVRPNAGNDTVPFISNLSRKRVREHESLDTPSVLTESSLASADEVYQPLRKREKKSPSKKSVFYAGGALNGERGDTVEVYRPLRKREQVIDGDDDSKQLFPASHNFLRKRTPANQSGETPTAQTDPTFQSISPEMSVANADEEDARKRHRSRVQAKEPLHPVPRAQKPSVRKRNRLPR